MDDFKLFFSLQTRLNAKMMLDIFGKDWPHYQEKWVRSNDNFLYFMSSLDDLNKEKVIEWARKNLEQPASFLE
jgi:hypothetical protein